MKKAYILFLILSLSSFNCNAETFFSTEDIPPGKNVVIDITKSKLNLYEAINATLNWEINHGSKVTIKIPSGTHIIKTSIHPRNNITIEGEGSDKTILKFEYHGDAFFIGQGIHIPMIDKLTIKYGYNDKSMKNNYSGILAEYGGSVKLGNDVVIDGFYYGVQARTSSVINAKKVKVLNAGDAGFFAYQGGHIDAQDSISENTNDQDNHLGSGYVAEYGGSIDASRAISKNSFLGGFTALTNGTIKADYAKAINNQYGVFASQNGSVSFIKGHFENNKQDTQNTLGGQIFLQNNTKTP